MEARGASLKPHYVESLQPPDVHHIVAALWHYTHDLHSSLGGEKAASGQLHLSVHFLSLPSSRCRGHSQGVPDTRQHPLPPPVPGQTPPGTGCFGGTRGQPGGEPGGPAGVSTSSSEVSRLAFLEYLRKSCKANGEKHEQHDGHAAARLPLAPARRQALGRALLFYFLIFFPPSNTRKRCPYVDFKLRESKVRQNLVEPVTVPVSLQHKLCSFFINPGSNSYMKESPQI